MYQISPSVFRTVSFSFDAFLIRAIVRSSMIPSKACSRRAVSRRTYVP